MFICREFTQPEATLYTEEYESYNRLQRVRHTVCHGKEEWARDHDGDGIREVHINSMKAAGSVWVIFCDRIAAFMTAICPVIPLSMNWRSITNVSRPRSFQS